MSQVESVIVLRKERETKQDLDTKRYKNVNESLNIIVMFVMLEFLRYLLP